MNNKLKISLLGTLIIGSSLAFALPIVSCSAKTPVEDPQPIQKIISASLIENNWLQTIQYIIEAPEIDHFNFRFKEINDYINSGKKLLFFLFEKENYRNFDLDFKSINLNDRKNPNNFYWILEVFEKDTYFEIDNIKFTKAKIIVDCDPEYFLNSKIRIEKII